MVSRDRPRRCAVTLRAFLAEQPEVSIFCRVTPNAIQRCVCQVFVELIQIRYLQPGLQGLYRRRARVICAGGPHEGMRSNSRQGHMIHEDGPCIQAQMLHMAGRTRTDVSVKCGGLTSQKSLTIGMTDRALGDGDSNVCFVARLALVRKGGVRRRQRARTDELFKGGGRRARVIDGNPGGHNAANDQDEPK